MPQKKPSVVVVTAFVQVAFGVFGVFDALSTLLSAQGMVAFLGGLKPYVLFPVDFPRVIAYVGDQLPSVVPALYVLTALDVVLCVLMVVGGIGLYRLRPWGRNVTLAYVLLDAVAWLVTVVYLWGFFVPTFCRCGDTFLAEATQKADTAGVFLYTLAYAIAGLESVGILYPALILFVVTRPSFRAAFTENAGEVSGPTAEATAAQPPEPSAPAGGVATLPGTDPTGIVAGPPKS
jgi:hypothetical protein